VLKKIVYHPEKFKVQFSEEHSVFFTQCEGKKRTWQSALSKLHLETIHPGVCVNIGHSVTEKASLKSQDCSAAKCKVLEGI
jgi:hypothetical protein